MQAKSSLRYILAYDADCGSCTSGMAIFKDLKEVQKFTMIKSTPFDSGIAELHLEPKRN